jgi:hypothetical protein
MNEHHRAANNGEILEEIGHDRGVEGPIIKGIAHE